MEIRILEEELGDDGPYCEDGVYYCRYCGVKLKKCSTYCRRCWRKHAREYNNRRFNIQEEVE